MDNPELAERMQFLTIQKEQLTEDLQEKKSEASQQENEQIRMNEIRNWIKNHPAGLKEYDDHITRELIQKITVINTETIGITFVGEDQDRIQNLKRT